MAGLIAERRGAGSAGPLALPLEGAEVCGSMPAGAGLDRPKSLGLWTRPLGE